MEMTRTRGTDNLFSAVGAFAELLAKSNFSFLEGASHPEELAERAHAIGLRALALCDRDGLYGMVRAHVAAKEVGLPIVVGAELSLENELGQARRDGSCVSLLVEDATGYASLCRLLTRAHADYDKGDSGITVREIAEDGGGLFALLPLDPQHPLSANELGMLRDAFGERCAIATWRHLQPSDAARVQAAQNASERYGLPIVASARPLYHHRSRKPLSDVLSCIRLKTTLDRAGTALGGNAETELKPGRVMQRLFPSHPEWIERSAAIAERCRFSLDELHYQFPSKHGPSPGEASPDAVSPDALSSDALSPDEVLRIEVERGIPDRYPQGAPPEVRAQIEKELRLIAELDVAPYFSSVKQVVDIARSRRILCQGRGSAANSAVCFVLGITAVDPVRSSLLFERFMSSERREPPDIDVDFEHERREEVIQEIYRRYGRDRAAMVSEVICYRGKSALREVGKVFGLSGDQLDRLSSIASHYNSEPVAADALAKRGLDPESRALEQVVKLAQQLEGFPRHLSIHVGGFVLSSEPLEHVAPVEPARMEGRTVIPWDKDDLDALGFFKIDVLGLGMLTAIRKALFAIHQREGGTLESFDPIAALASIPPEDPAVYDMVCKADTVGVFQIESRAQMAMLPLLQPRKFYDLVVEVGIVRPGPIQGKMVHPYLRRRTGEEEVSYPHPCLAPILERTLGVPLFQEQVMQIAIVGAGYSGGEADQLRRDMAAWRRTGRLARHRDKLLDGFRRRGIPKEFGERLYQQIMGFGEYGFPESHAASFALLVYASSWIKVHYPEAFACALINSQPMGFYSPASLVRDAQKHGVEVRPVRVQNSDWDCTLEPPVLAPQVVNEERGDRSCQQAPCSQAQCSQALRLGFRLVAGLRQTAAEAILEARRDEPFTGIDNFAVRSGLRRDEVERLAEAGALEELADCRR
jgi:error-prone DNA polymerase